MNTGFLGSAVATVLTVYGIETCDIVDLIVSNNVATVLTVYGIETSSPTLTDTRFSDVATVLTVYGIETPIKTAPMKYRNALQQYLPFTVLKPYGSYTI